MALLTRTALCVCCDKAPAMGHGVLCASCFDREYAPDWDQLFNQANRKEN